VSLYAWSALVWRVSARQFPAPVLAGNQIHRGKRTRRERPDRLAAHYLDAARTEHVPSVWPSDVRLAVLVNVCLSSIRR
jgi:hypothetical protein